jgi:GGDEF domain-containing protein
LGIALRECLRKADIPGWLGEGTFAVVLPHTGEGAVVAAERITGLLSQVAGCQAASGVVVYPADARDLGVLLQIAATRAGESEEGTASRDEGSDLCPVVTSKPPA